MSLRCDLGWVEHLSLNPAYTQLHPPAFHRCHSEPLSVVLLQKRRRDRSCQRRTAPSTIKDQNGEETMFNIKRTTKMGKVFTRMIVTEGCRWGIPGFPYWWHSAIINTWGRWFDLLRIEAVWHDINIYVQRHNWCTDQLFNVGWWRTSNCYDPYCRVTSETKNGRWKA